MMSIFQNKECFGMENEAMVHLSSNAIIVAKLYIKDQMTKKIRSPINAIGSKQTLSSWIIEYFPEDYHEMIYVEPYCGGANVFLNKLPSTEEIINDTDRGIVQIFKAMRDEPCEIIGRIKRTKFSERSFKRAKKKYEEGIDDYVEGAIAEIILRRMSKDGSVFSHSSEGVETQREHEWDRMIEHLDFIKDRIDDTHIFCDQALKIIKIWDSPNAVMYVDPPYLSKDSTTEPQDNEMSIDDHIKLANLLNNSKSYIMLSGHPSTLYNRLYKDWDCVKKNGRKTKRRKDRRIECIWKNY